MKNSLVLILVQPGGAVFPSLVPVWSWLIILGITLRSRLAIDLVAIL